MKNKLFYRITGALVFLISFVQFVKTAQPSVSFWDCGEFTAAAVNLQVPHPPGAPFFAILGRFFSMIPFLGNNLGFRVNMISILSSALSILLLYLTAVKLIENFRGRQPKDLLDEIVTYVAAAIGALAFSFSDTFWFNGVESEVYASSTFLFALITWLIVVWNDRADEHGNERYLLMIAFLVGLSMGVHLMSVLGVVPVVMVIVFRKYVQDFEACKKTGYIFLAHSAIVLLVAIGMWSAQTSQQVPSPEEFKAFDSKFVWIMIGLSAVFMGFFWKKIFSRNSFYTGLIIGGITLMVCYPGVVKKLPGLLLSISGNDNYGALAVLIVMLVMLAGVIYWSVKNNKPTVHLASLSLLFVVIGFTTYAMVVIRANKQTPMNENEPNDFSELVSYLNREQYGDFPEFKRRFASEPHQEGVYQNYSSDLDFFWKYQMNHMFNRYLGWNFIGREGWDQDLGVDWKQFFGIPFLIGLFGIFFHFKRDWKMASVFMVMFIFQGYLTAFYQNQQEPQPRERDYFYVGAFLVFSIWIALGIKGIAELIRDGIKDLSTSRALTYAMLLIGVVAIPVNMAAKNWNTHDRSNNWIPWDYAYNLLQSCAPDAVLFTNGDNDTFPLWYLQDVEGVRRDVRIANLSLINTTWYIKQLKNTEPYGAKKVAISYSDAMIDQLQPVRWDPQNISVPVPPEVVKSYLSPSNEDQFSLLSTVQKGLADDSSVVKSGKMTFRMPNTIQYGDIKAVRTQDLLVKDIVEQNKWKRPIYFAITCSDDSKIGLQDYLIMEGLAQRLVPFKRKGNTDYINEGIMKAQLFNDKPQFSKTYKAGFNLRGLDNKNIFFDDNHERLTQNYRSSYLRLAVYYLYGLQKKDECLNTLARMEKVMPEDVVKMPYSIKFETANLFYTAGDMKKYEKLAHEIEKVALKQLEANPSDFNSPYNPYMVLPAIYGNLKQYDKAIDIWTRIHNVYPNDPYVNSELERYRTLAAGPKNEAPKQ